VGTKEKMYEMITTILLFEQSKWLGAQKYQED
jgi:hypothetical protein